MEYVSGYTCTICNKKFEKNYQHLVCDECHDIGILDVNYDYQSMKKEINKEYFKNNHNYSMFRYHKLMTIKNQNFNKMLKVGWTPLYKSYNLSKKLDIDNLYFKDEGLNPTASLKDRASAVAVLKAIEEGKDTICCSSTGNAASSLAGNAAKMGIKSVIFVPKRAPLGKLSQLVIYGSKVFKVDGDYKKTYEISKEAINKYKFYNRNAAINPHLVEGKKTVIYEVMEQLNFESLDYVFVSVGDGCTIGSVYKGLYDLFKLDLIKKIPKIVGVQSSGCSPFYNAWLNSEPLKETEENTIADSIAVGIPRNPVKGLNAVLKTGGYYMTVTDDEILDAMSILGENEGLFGEPAGVTALSGLLKAKKLNKITKTDKIAIIVTGNGLKDPKSIESKVSKIHKIKNDIKELQKHIKNNEVKK
ncbi:threonine synthase [Candidatus Izimaplasma bacterium ZiA1]|uniref:threonine synthase n=1 Tax=Candidatus Izimoplasma sp. ZiA1 TaxID=2024899 RepID=UPI000BAA8568|nr:threonine synthase [Candidatus Izimaplasma bacterium ZiA1]